MEKQKLHRFKFWECGGIVSDRFPTQSWPSLGREKSFCKCFREVFRSFHEVFQSFSKFFEVFASFSRLSDPFGPIGMHSDAFGSNWNHLDAFDKIWDVFDF